VPGPDPGHWLHRLTAPEWLAAADAELVHAREALERRATRPGVAHARRAAGMAWNAVLIGAPDERAGRSYMDHVVALADDDAIATPDDVRAAARLLRDSPARPPELIAIGKPDLSALDAARAIVAYARGLIVT
jgi:HEPN domain-containing protein